jgi:cytosine/uracil/thiamine/allantoin permease
MTKKVTISSNNISPKQWSVLLLELNLMKKSWRPFATLEINAPDFNRTVKWGSRRYDAKEE